MTVNNSTSATRWSGIFYDIQGAAASPYDTATSVGDTSLTGGVINDQPVITPTTPNGLVIAIMSDGIGPVFGYASGAPSGAIFDCVNYDNENDGDQFDNADAKGHIYHTGIATQHWNWSVTYPGGGVNSLAVAFKAAS